MGPMANEFDFQILEKLLFALDEDHSSSTLSGIKDQLNALFNKVVCKGVYYSVNTDKLMFGLRVYPQFDGEDALDIIENPRDERPEAYCVEFDSKLFDPILNLNEKEILAILLHDIYNVVISESNLTEVKNQLNMYLANSGDYIDPKSSKGYRELLAFGLKDALMKNGSLFTKFGKDFMTDEFVESCGYAPYLERAFRKIYTSEIHMERDVDDRFIILSWVLRLRGEYSMFRVPSFKTLKKAASLTPSELERRELEYAANIINKSDLGFSEGAFDNLKTRFNNSIAKFKRNGVRGIKNDVYELNLRLRCAADQYELMSIIRQANNDIAILQDYLTEDIPDAERKDILNAISELYDIRERAAKEQAPQDANSMIQVYYPGYR
jgi:hypothetical protein